MDMEDVPPHSQSRKRWRIDCSSNGTGSNDAKVLVPKKMEKQQLHGYHDEDEDGDGDGSNDKDRLLAWHSSRIFRVSRASGGKDRHSKVLTAKGLRDRRVRLSVSTAIQFYDLQNRLGYDQPSKAVEWLIKKAADAIAELPSLNNTAFPPTPKQASDEKRPEPEPTETDQVHPFTFHNHQQQQQLIHLSGSACSSTSETSKGSVLSLSRSEIRVKARERARERAAKEREKDKEKEKENDSHVFHNQHHQSPTPNPSSNPQTSFTDLLTVNASNTASLDTATARHHPNADLFPKHFREMAAPMDYFGRQHQHQHQHQQAMVSHGVSRPQHYPLLLSSFGSPPPLNVLPLNISTTTSSAGDHAELQHFSFIQDHIIPEAQAPPNDYNLNFSISSSQQAGFNRGTLQSNTPSSMSHHHLPHKYPSPVDGPPSLPFFVSPAAAENNQFPAGFDGRLQLYFGDTCRHSDLKGKSKWGP